MEEEYVTIDLECTDKVFETLQYLSKELNLSIDKLVESAIVSQLIEQALKDRPKGE